MNDIKKEIVGKFLTACEVSTFKKKEYNQAMWELLNDGCIVPVSKTLWMATSAASKKYA